MISRQKYEWILKDSIVDKSSHEEIAKKFENYFYHYWYLSFSAFEWKYHLTRFIKYKMSTSIKNDSFVNLFCYTSYFVVVRKLHLQRIDTYSVSGYSLPIEWKGVLGLTIMRSSYIKDNEIVKTLYKDIICIEILLKNYVSIVVVNLLEKNLYRLKKFKT